MSKIKDAIQYLEAGANQGEIRPDYARLAADGLDLLDKIRHQEAKVNGYSLHELVIVAEMMEDIKIKPRDLHKMCWNMKKMYEVLLKHSTVEVKKTVTGNVRAARKYPDFRTVMKAMKGGSSRG